MARFVGHLSVAELEARYRAARDVTEARHYQAIWLLARRPNVSGPEALGDRRRRNGRAASLLTPGVLSALAARLKEPPEDGGLWSGPKVAAWMARHLGLAAVHPQRGWEALKRLEWSVQAPRPRHPRSAGPEQREALKKSWTRRSRRPRPNTPTARWRSGRRMSTASA